MLEETIEDRDEVSPGEGPKGPARELSLKSTPPWGGRAENRSQAVLALPAWVYSIGYAASYYRPGVLALVAYSAFPAVPLGRDGSTPPVAAETTRSVLGAERDGGVSCP